ncbi:terminase large subunit domain-containing protein [Saccharothrix hoggarensis]|uniref:Terminase large subunit domain-containing protein n=1 Tax=Saccharothrix hoggarensis TaxID=913853 RepID=A0ABW3QKN2_9PSEU
MQLKLMKLRRLRELKTERQHLEAERLRNIDVFEQLGYRPNCLPFMRGEIPAPCGQCPQEQFHAATEFDVLYGGAAGGGKTKALLMEGLRACVRYPGLRVGAFRRTYPELEESLLAELTEVGFAKALGAHWNGTKYNLLFPNGSRLMFRYAETLQDATRRQGGQYQLLLFDERTLTPPNVISFLESRLRSGRADIPVLGIRSGTNPGGPGHGFAKDRYIVPTSYGSKTYRDVRGREVRFIPSKLSDNPHVNPEYQHDLDALPEQLRSAFRDGNWDTFAGQMFSEWSYDRHVVKPMTLPKTWKRYNGIDWGYSKPWAVLWAAVDEDGRVWVYRELYKTRVGESDQAKMILAAEAEDEHVSSRWADDAMWATRGEARPVSDIYAENGVYLTPAGKGGRVAGWQRVHSYLGEGPACAHHRAMGWATCPMVHVFETVTELIRTLPTLPHALSGDPEDADTNAEDHSPDAFRYLVINLGGGAEFVIHPDQEEPPEVATVGVYAYRADPSLPAWSTSDVEHEPGAVTTMPDPDES